MIKKTYNVDLKKNQTLYLVTLGDVGFSGVRCDQKELERDLRWLRERKRRGDLVRIVGLGDWLAFPSPSERAALISANKGYGLYDSTQNVIDEAMMERCTRWEV